MEMHVEIVNLFYTGLPGNIVSSILLTMFLRKESESVCY